MRILSGVQPSGKLHLGNYFGAIKQHLQLQEEGEAFYFIADYHALTTVHDKKAVEEYTMEVAIAYLALGIDPNKVVFFRQSDVPEVCELAWLLGCTIGLGLLERAHSYKDKIAKGIKPSFGLFAYPVLMAADILAYKSDVVPVGKDQVQHVEMTQDMAQAFNYRYGEVFKRPEAKLSKSARVPGIDGQKMSKSYGNTIEIFASKKDLKKSVMRIVTDSKPLGSSLDPDSCNVFKLYSLFAGKEERTQMDETYRSGEIGYGDAKKKLLLKIEEYFSEARDRREDLLKRPDFVQDVLRQGARKARETAFKTVQEARDAVGLGPRIF
ncbi:MAG: tryptophan--tRNA ligase [Deltaproteobacteria bacterium]|nr:tryptophan--tRNA ligase [Deltaproteobacteria bacterium]